MLNKLINKKSLTLLGLNSGTSADAVDMAVLKIKRIKNRPSISYLTGAEYKFPTRLKEAVLNVADNRMATVVEMLKLDFQLGHFFGSKAAQFIDKLSENKIKIDLIASHGQTVRHLPNHFKHNNKNQSATLQLGAPAQIACLTNKIVVTDFRQAEIALGGEGAPITTKAMDLLFGEGKQKLIVNIGGMTGHTGAAHRVHVVTAKAGLVGLSKGLAHELSPRGITVNCVVPGLIDTVRIGNPGLAPHHHNKSINLVGRKGRPDEIAEAVSFLCGGNSRYITGETLHVNGGAYLS